MNPRLQGLTGRAEPTPGDILCGLGRTPPGVRRVILVAALVGLLVASAHAAVGETIPVSVANDGAQASGGNREPAINADGRSVAFVSDATDLVAGDTTSIPDVFIHE
jgi:hypothetical protein